MSYLSVRKFWEYQNADAWKKAKATKRGHPQWFKHSAHRDGEIDVLPPMARLLWYELLGCATRHHNVLQNEVKWLSRETHLDAKDVAKHLPLLLKGGWLSESERPRRSRRPSRKNLDSLATRSRSEKLEEDLNPGLSTSTEDASEQGQDFDIRKVIHAEFGGAA